MTTALFVLQPSRCLIRLHPLVLPGLEITETDQDTNVITIPLPRELNEDEQDEYANRLADYYSK